MSSQNESLESIKKDVIHCVLCGLSIARKNAVPGSGGISRKIILIGEAPGKNEDETGSPFVGSAGKILDQALIDARIERKEIYITNVVKCRPPNNRDPLPDEIETCTSNYLDHQIEIVSPSIIVTLGRFSMGKFFKGAKISQIHGQMQKVGERFVIAMFHPAAALHQAALKPAIMADFAKLPELLKEARAALGKSAPKEKKQEKKEDDPKQMNLF